MYIAGALNPEYARKMPKNDFLFIKQASYCSIIEKNISTNGASTSRYFFGI